MTNYERENEISTDEIIKRLERCVKRGNRNYDTDIVLDLIYRQQEDIERLRSMNCAKLDTIHDLQADTNKLKEQLQDVQERYEEAQTKIEQWKDEANKYQKLWCIAVDDIETAKSEAIQEFAKKLKKEFLTLEYQVNTTRKTLPIDFVKDQIKWLLQEISIDIIDSLVKEYEKGR